jgi:hypothetical protein
MGKMTKSRAARTATLVLVVGLAGAVLLGRQAIQDAVRLHGYTAPPVVSDLATDDTMTAKARHLLYVNHPAVTSGSDFTGHCPAGDEKTVVLGCYTGNDNGIYVYQVSDARLNGVEQVTTAHEMLHAAYRRLSSAQRKQVNAWLMDYYQHDLTDQRIKNTIAAYQKSEPNDVVNEMHSVFGTEVADLPAPLENYYKQYFQDRAKVTAYTASYQAEFTGRQQQVADFDAQLKALKPQIESGETSLNQQQASLSAQNQQLQAQRAAGQVAAYNTGVAGYNQAVQRYNSLLGSTKSLISQYNDIVAKRNSLALEEQQLAQELSASSLPQ